MGLTKRLYEEQLERGWSSLGKYICADCLASAPLKEVVAENVEGVHCDYCDRVAAEPIATDTDILMTHIGESFRSEYTDPANVLPYETAEGGYQGEWFDTDDLVWRIGEEIGCDEFVNDLIDAYSGSAWCDRDYFGSSPDEVLSFSWKRFAELVKYESRYLFLEHREKDAFDDRVGPGEMLSRIADYVVEGGLLTEIAPGTPIFRARPHAHAESYTTAADLGTAPRERTFSNRMSPAGIAHFYGALHAETAVAEVWDGRRTGREVVSVGQFSSPTALPVIDLARLPEVPSIFDARRRHLRPVIRFLHEFSEHVSEPVNAPARSEQDVVAYVPTQIVSEYFRTVFGRSYPQVLGLVYRSARRPDGVSCVLFVSREACLDGDTSLPPDEVALVLEHVERFEPSAASIEDGDGWHGGERVALAEADAAPNS
jgi:HEPN/RES N-terminal domain 1/RES domain